MWTTNVNFEIIDLSVIEFVCIRVIQIIANEYLKKIFLVGLGM